MTGAGDRPGAGIRIGRQHHRVGAAGRRRRRGRRCGRRRAAGGAGDCLVNVAEVVLRRTLLSGRVVSQRARRQFARLLTEQMLNNGVDSLVGRLQNIDVGNILEEIRKSSIE